MDDEVDGQTEGTENQPHHYQMMEYASLEDELRKDGLLDDDEDDDDDEDEEDGADNKNNKNDKNKKNDKNADDRAIKNRFKKIKKEAPYRFFPHVKFSEKPIVNYMKKRHNAEYEKFNRKMAERKQAFWHRAKMIAGTVLPWLLVFFGLMMAGLFIAAAIDAMFSWLNGGGSGSGSGGSNSPYGIMGDKFYGARMVYKDEELARTEILKDFVLTIGDVEKAIEQADSRVDVTINLPTNEFDYSAFDELTFQTDYSNTYQIMVEMAGLIAEFDRAEGETAEYSTLTEKVDAIKYFGVNNELATGGDNNLALIVANNIKNNVLYTIDTTGESTPTVAEVEELITNKVQEVLTAKPQTRTEKLFVKDYILDSDKRMENVPQENYVAMIYLPKTNVSMNYFSFVVAKADFDNLTITLKNGDNEIDLTKSLFTTEEEGSLSYLFETADNLNINVNTTELIDTQNLNALSSAKSLYQIAADSTLDANIYLEDNADGIKTVKTSGVVVEMNSEQAFAFSEFETKYE